MIFKDLKYKYAFCIFLVEFIVFTILAFLVRDFSSTDFFVCAYLSSAIFIISASAYNWLKTNNWFVLSLSNIFITGLSILTPAIVSELLKPDDSGLLWIIVGFFLGVNAICIAIGTIIFSKMHKVNRTK